MAKLQVWVMVAVVATVGLMPLLATAADADPLQDYCVADTSGGLTINGFPCKRANEATVSDFLFDGFRTAGAINNQFTATPATVTQFPGLNTLGISTVRLDFPRGTINPPHTHPRATESLLLIQGELYVGFVSTSNILFATVLKAGQLFVFPRGLVHFQLNVGIGSALAYASLTSQNPGTQQVAAALFTPDIRDEVLEKGFRIDPITANIIQARFRV